MAGRSQGLCEYCLISEEFARLGCALDHIISEKHRGPTEADNLANACVICNRAKESDIGSIHWDSGEFVRFFNPRKDLWADHFVLVEARIDSTTRIGAVTALILGFNDPERLSEREELIVGGCYPSAAAKKRMEKNLNC